MPKTESRLGIMSAMPQELSGIRELLVSQKTHSIGDREVATGELAGVQAATAFSRWGKVAAAITATTLIEHFACDKLVFFGVAGGVVNTVSPGDVVIANGSFQHDLDGRPLLKRYQVPLTDRTVFATDRQLSEGLHQAVEAFFASEHMDSVRNALAELGVTSTPIIHRGLVSTGDCFVTDVERLRHAIRAFPDTLCAEMEGGAVGQTCAELGVPYALLRVISDDASGSAHVDFTAFIERVACQYGSGVLRFFQP